MKLQTGVLNNGYSTDGEVDSALKSCTVISAPGVGFDGIPKPQAVTPVKIIKPDTVAVEISEPEAVATIEVDEPVVAAVGTPRMSKMDHLANIEQGFVKAFAGGAVVYGFVLFYFLFSWIMPALGY